MYTMYLSAPDSTSGTVGQLRDALRAYFNRLPKTHSKSSATCAAARAVISLWSNGGDTSTTSIPTRFAGPMPRTIASACAELKPPATGVPVPGAQAGSRQSISKVR